MILCKNCSPRKECFYYQNGENRTECKFYKPMTEQEWLQTASTEQLAEWLRGVYWHCHAIDCEQCNYPWRCMEKREIVEWLKQPHTENE